jgi:hypothetical protein
MENNKIGQEELKILFNKHPVITKNYLIITPVVAQVYEMVRERVFMRKTGTFMYASPRIGKTFCARIIKLLLIREFPSIFILDLIAEAGQRTDKEILGNILESAKLLPPKRSSYQDIQRQLSSHIQSNLASLEGSQFVLMIDEMQNLSDKNLDCLAALHNRLKQAGVNMTTIGFAQPEILDVRSSLLASNKSYLIARFLCEPVSFNGCVSILDLEKILHDYDEIQHFPEGSEYSFTRFFLPNAYQNGFRLRKYADEIWKILKTAAGSYSESIPMEHLSRTIEYLLVASSAFDSDKFKVKSDLIESAVAASNLAYFSGLLEPTKG